MYTTVAALLKMRGGTHEEAPFEYNSLLAFREITAVAGQHVQTNVEKCNV